jgi:hypothetical protein
MREAIPPLPNTPSWHGAHLKHGESFTFTFAFSNEGIGNKIKFAKELLV